MRQPSVGHVERADEQLDLLADVLDRVVREPLELGAHVARATSMAASTRLDRLARSRWPPPSPPTSTRSPSTVTGAPSGRLHDLVADVVDQRDAGLAQQQRPEVRVAAADRRRRRSRRRRARRRPASPPRPGRGRDGRSPRCRPGCSRLTRRLVRRSTRATPRDRAASVASPVRASPPAPRGPAAERRRRTGPGRHARRSNGRRAAATRSQAWSVDAVARIGRAVGSASVEAKSPSASVHVSAPRSPAAVASSSAAWARAASLSGWPESMRDSSTTRSGSVEHARRGHGCRLVALLRHPHLGVGVGGDLRQVGHDEHLVRLIGQPGQRPTDGDRGGAADAGVDLVEHQCRWRSGEHEAQREHGPRQLATRGDLGQRQRRRSRVGGEPQLDVVAGVVAAHHHLDLRLGHGQLGQVGLHCGRPAGRRVPAGGGHLAAASASAGACGGEAGVELGRPAVVVLELGQPDPEPVALGQHVGQRLAVLAPQIVQELPAFAHLGRGVPGPRRSPRRRPAARPPRRSARPPASAAAPRHHRRARAPPGAPAPSRRHRRPAWRPRARLRSPSPLSSMTAPDAASRWAVASASASSVAPARRPRRVR